MRKRIRDAAARFLNQKPIEEALPPGLAEEFRKEQAANKAHLRRYLRLNIEQGMTLADVYDQDPQAASVIGPQEPGDELP
jgi:hypothetical protein